MAHLKGGRKAGLSVYLNGQSKSRQGFSERWTLGDRINTAYTTALNYNGKVW
jgi:hypothetical protein